MNPTEISGQSRDAINARAHSVALAETGSDSELLLEFIERRNPAAMETIVRRHGPMVMGLCRQLLRDTHTAADAFQATFLVLLQHRRIGKPASLASWLYGVAYRVATRARLQTQQHPTAQIDNVPTEAASPMSEAASRETIGMIHSEIHALPERYRLPVILCCLEGESQETVALRLGWSANSLRGRLERGRELLRVRLERRGVALSATMLAALLTREAVAQVPPWLIAATIESSQVVAASQSLLGGTISPHVAQLSQSVSQAMQLKLIGKAVLAASLFVAAAAIVWRSQAQDLANGPPAAGVIAVPNPGNIPGPFVGAGQMAADGAGQGVGFGQGAGGFGQGAGFGQGPADGGGPPVAGVMGAGVAGGPNVGAGTINDRVAIGAGFGAGPVADADSPSAEAPQPAAQDGRPN